MSPIEDRHPDVLQNIEYAIVATYRKSRELTDYDVMRVLDAVLENYAAEKDGRIPRNARFSPLEQVLHGQVRQICEWRLGRATLGDDEKRPPKTPIPLDDMILCLKRLIKSAGRWNKQGGRQGYLNYVIQFIR
ncbi:MAG: hypothetical protein GX580_12585 [Candidatus Hydrogenedens sp.]|nr:hypothetical protein [Candidatus Hydrogenedentota bacterium]NLF58462.1 hypothetical protein [Candidatus Hydrogenedens sp.]